MNTIQDSWKSFEDTLLKGKPKYQIDSMQKAFYAGAASIINIFIKIADDDISIDACAAIFENLREECMDFYAQFLKEAEK